ncbi:MAG TPA: hypothetical protein VG318_05340 [Actinomycetota bacterium]|nr:hypothetical protein [Actinomycetota bacterium]
MSLDSTLRSGLVASGDSIVVNVEQGLREVHGAVVRRRRRITAGTAAALALVLAASDTGIRELHRPGPPPAREVDERLDPPDLRRHEGGLPLGPAEPGTRNETVTRGRSGEAVPQSDGARRAVAGEPRSRSAPEPHGDPFVPFTDVRSFVERYETTRVAGVAVGENGGLGCSDGKGTLGGNDCFFFEVHGHETRLAIRLLDNAGAPVHATVFMDPPGEDETAILARLCGGTVAPLPVVPDATISVHIGGTDECPGPVTTGKMRVRLWAG